MNTPIDLALADLTRLMQNRELLTQLWIEQGAMDEGRLEEGEIVISRVGKPLEYAQSIAKGFAQEKGLHLPADWVSLFKRFNGIDACPHPRRPNEPRGLQVVEPNELSEPFLWPVQDYVQFGLEVVDAKEGLGILLGDLPDSGYFVLELSESPDEIKPIYWQQDGVHFHIADDLAGWLSLLHQSALHVPHLLRRAKVPNWG
jgi:hypothetical protein